PTAAFETGPESSHSAGARRTRRAFGRQACGPRGAARAQATRAKAHDGGPWNVRWRARQARTHRSRRRVGPTPRSRVTGVRQGVVIVMPRHPAEGAPAAGLWTLAAGWGGAAQRRFGSAWVVTLDGVTSPQQVLSYSDPEPGSTS